MTNSTSKKKDIVATQSYTTTYAMIDRGDGLRCAWCDKRNPTNKHLKKCKELSND